MTQRKPKKKSKPASRHGSNVGEKRGTDGAPVVLPTERTRGVRGGTDREVVPVQFKVSAAERRAIELGAKREEMTLSAFVRKWSLRGAGWTSTTGSVLGAKDGAR